MFLVTTESGTSYEIDNENLRVRRADGGSLRRDGEWIDLQREVSIREGDHLRMMLAPLVEEDECIGTLRITTKVASVERRVVR